jgi:hypothetical protein
MTNQHLDCIPIPVFGAPLAGKRSIINIVGEAYKANISIRYEKIQIPAYSEIYDQAIYEAHFRKLENQFRLICMPGNSPIESSLHFLNHGDKCICVLDAQPARMEQQREIYALLKSIISDRIVYAVITKTDINEVVDEVEFLKFFGISSGISRIKFGLTQPGSAELLLSFFDSEILL